MTSNLPSNPIAAELRASAGECYERAADEIERLTAELAHARAEARAMHSAYESANKALAGVQNHSSSLPAGGQSHTELNRTAVETAAAPCDCNAEKWDGRHAGWCRAYRQSENGEGGR